MPRLISAISSRNSVPWSAISNRPARGREAPVKAPRTWPNTSDSRQGGTVNRLVHAHLAYLEYPNGGAVFSTGSIAWSGSLSYNNYTNNVSRITENVLRRFASDEPLPAPSPARSPELSKR